MRHYRDVIFSYMVLLMAAPAALAQTPAVPAPAADQDTMPPPSWAYNDLACAPYLTTTAPAGALRVAGSQDTVIKNMMGPGDTIVISGGSAGGLEVGQRYFVRRLIKTFGNMRGPDKDHPLPVHTAAWIQIVGVDTTVATAAVVHACEGILLDDYLEPFVAPTISTRTSAGTAPLYENMAHIKTGVEGSQVFGIGQLANIDRGSKLGVAAGQRYMVFRDKRTLLVPTRAKSDVFEKAAMHMPLVEIGEVLVVSSRPDDATVQIVTQKDAIRTGDLIAEVQGNR
jgi:hypothetical protein